MALFPNISDLKWYRETFGMEKTKGPVQIKTPDPNEAPMTCCEKIKYFLKSTWRGILCVVTPIIAALIFLPLKEKYQWCGVTLVIMAVYWVTECVALPITSFIPLVIFPITDIMTTAQTCNCYFNDTIIMFLGSLILAGAMEQSGLHLRLALCAIRCVGYSHYKLLFAMCFTTMFISMWITNTAATTMMVPITFAVLKVFEGQKILKIYEVDSLGESFASDLTVCYFCSATFSATIGGIGTLVGTATNLVFKGLFMEEYKSAPEYLSFPKFSAFTIPYMLLMETVLYFCMIFTYFGFLRPKSDAAKRSKLTPEAIKAAEDEVNGDWKKMGMISLWEVLVGLLFAGCMILFFSRSPKLFTGWADAILDAFGITDNKFIRDSAPAMFVAFLMFLIPSSCIIFKNCARDYSQRPRQKTRSVLDYPLLNKSMPWSFVFLLGGGFALSTAAKPEYSNLNGFVGKLLQNLQGLPNLLIIFIVIIFTVIITNFASNVAVANVIVPIAMQMAYEVNENPLWYNIAAGLSASYCFCLPVGTPGNLIVQSAAKIPTGKMIIAGLAPTIFVIILTWLAISFWAPVVWPDLHTMPDWIKK